MIEPMQYTDEELLDAMIQFYKNEGRWPKLRDMKAPYPGKTTYARRFASAPGKDDGFGNALKLAQERYEIQEREALEAIIDKESANAQFGRFGEAMNNLGKALADEVVGFGKRIMGRGRSK